MRHRKVDAPLTVLMCDGIICDGFIYKYLWDDLTPFASVAHYHYRGHGRSELPRDENAIGVEDHARDMNAVREHLGDRPVVLVGHSVGTQVILEAYRQRPKNVRGLVMLCGSYGRVTHTFKGSDRLAQLLPTLVRLALEHPRVTRALWSRVPPKLAVRIAMLTGEVDPGAIRSEDLEPYFRHLAHVNLALFLRMLERAGEHTAQDLLPRVNVPTLVIAGDRDSFTPPALSRWMVEQLPRAELISIAGGTHVTPLEHRSRVGLEVSRFCAKVAPPVDAEEAASSRGVC